MRKLLLSACSVAVMATTVNAQDVVATFDTLQLPKADTFFVTYDRPNEDVGFNDGLAYFPCYYDTAYGGMWSEGFAYSNMTDSMTSGYLNPYSAKTAEGYDGSSNYVVFWQGYFGKSKIKFTGADAYIPQGFYITNSTYAYNSMRDGDDFAKKFGGESGNDADWFRLVAYGYRNGTVADSIDFYLADFRFNNNDSDYIVKDWKWFGLESLGLVDSISFQLTSSDANTNGMLTPAYFCMDNFTVRPVPLSVNNTYKDLVAKVYPNPAKDQLFVELNSDNAQRATVLDMSGKILSTWELQGKVTLIPVASLPAGMYVLQLDNGKQKAATRFVKQ